jgi:glycolate oxidase FAD binding subunit
MMRAGTPDDAVLGHEPRFVYEPSTIDDARAALERLSKERLASVFVGGGTKLGLGAAPSRLDAVVRTTKLSRVVEYSPSDQVVSVEAGLTLGALQAELGAERQRLSLDAPWPERATIGGILAASSFGPLRARSGAVRDLVLGVSLVRADGVLARGGGKVVKNVAGFDLPKLACGSLGTLGLIAAATLRVHPVPESTEVCVVRGLAAAGVRSLVDKISATQLEPAALLARRSGDGGRWDVALAFEGFGAGVAQQVARLRGFADVASTNASDEDPFTAHRHARERALLSAKIAALPTSFPEVEALLAPLMDLFPRADLALYPTLGILFVSASADDMSSVSDAATVTALVAARRALGALRGTLTVEAAPAGVRAGIEAWSLPSSLALHKAVKSRFDPDGLLAPGRFVGGI